MVKPWSKIAILACAVSLAALSHGASADQRTTAINQKTIGLLASEPEYMPRVRQIARELRHDEGLRILPIVGDGSVQAVNDLLRLDSVDVALLPADAVAYTEGQGLIAGGSKKVAYVARMSSLPVMLVARKSIRNVTGLANKRISTGPAQSGAFATGELVLGNLGVPFVRVPKSGADGLAAMVSGEADAAIVLSTQNLDRLDPAAYHILNLPLPSGLEALYAPAIVDTAPVRALANNASVETISVPLVLAVYNWPKGNPHGSKLKLFAQAFFQHATEPGQTLLEPGTNIAATVTGWQRLDTAEESLTKLKEKQAKAEPQKMQQGADQ